MAEKQITEFVIYDPQTNKTIFNNSEAPYVIPLYQRAFAWEDKEITQLIDDIKDFDSSDGASYYLGSIIVARQEDVRNGAYEVIDGQQRLTALFLLLNYLQLPIESVLTFECRKKSDYTLEVILNNKDISVDTDEGLSNSKKIIETTFGGFSEDERKEFIEKLSQVKVYRIEVPENTDLNHYFEIMNTRGEQLEQQDILKADLMRELSPDDKAKFSKFWDACSDMTGYVQMHFDTETRQAVFGSDWTSFPNLKVKIKKPKQKAATKIQAIIDPLFPLDQKSAVADSDDRVRFESIIGFPHFLLHVLKVYVAAKNIDASINELLDDKKLTDTFKSVLENGTCNGQKLDKVEFANDFIKCLLKCRYLFDQYVVKREFVNDDSDGAWSIKCFQSSGQQSKKKPYYTNTYFGRKNKWKRILMLQSCLRVSYTSPKIVHWITELLKWLYNDQNRKKIYRMERTAEDIIRFGSRDNTNGSVTIKSFLETGDFDMGVNTPHLVFNYLDYLLWKKNGDCYSNFVFEFRNSVEHWYPQHPSEGTFEQWPADKGVNRFGNLCIIQRNVNSKFSNMSPESKQSTFEDMISKGSLKLRIMADLVRDTAQGLNPNS